MCLQRTAPHSTRIHTFSFVHALIYVICVPNHQDDVEEECSKHGRVLHIYVEAKLPGGLVYLFFADLEASRIPSDSIHSLHSSFLATPSRR